MKLYETLNLKRWWSLVICFYLFSVFATGLMPIHSEVPEQINIAHLDKVVHFITHFILLFLLHQLLNYKPLVLVCFGLFVGSIIEVLQIPLATRGFDYYDILANTAGTLSGFVASLTFLKGILSSIDHKLTQALK